MTGTAALKQAAEPGRRLGGYAWASATHGRLAAADRLRLLAQGVAFQLHAPPLQVGRRLGLGRRAGFDLDRLQIPDTTAAREAEQLCDAMRPDILVNHSYRTFVWAAVIAAHEGIRYDAEVVYVSSLLHDLGLSDDHRQGGGRCFTLIGAEAARRAGEGWEEHRRQLAADAITLHMNLRVPKDAPEAYLTAFGTQLDAVGARFWQIDADTRRAVLARYPRGHTGRAMCTLFEWQARENPGTRAHLYMRFSGLGWRLRHTPFGT